VIAMVIVEVGAGIVALLLVLVVVDAGPVVEADVCAVGEGQRGAPRARGGVGEEGVCRRSV